MNLLEMKNRRKDLVQQMRVILNTAMTHGRDLTPSEGAAYDKLSAEADQLTTRIEREDKVSTHENALRGTRDHKYRAGMNGPVHDDMSKYSITRAINMAASGRGLDGLEREVHDELARGMPKATSGILVPFSNLSVGGGAGGSDGGLLVELEKGNLSEIFRSRLVLSQLGALTLTGLQGDLDLPRLAAGSTATWKGEEVAVDESDPSFAQLQLRPKKVGTFVELSRQLLAQGSSDVATMIMNDLMAAVLGAWQLAAIAGTGADGQPRGILATVGIGDVPIGANGGAPLWTHIVALENALANIDADQGSLGYLTNSKVRGKLKTTIRNPAGTDSTYVWPDDNRLNGYATGITNHVPSNLTKGDAAGVCSALIFGNFADLALAQWGGGIELLVNPYSKDKEGIVRINASAFLDSGVLRPGSFAAVKDALTT